MTHIANFLHYLTIGAAVGINSIGASLGEGLTSKAALEAMDKQPSARADILKIAVLGMALIETAAIMGAAISIILLFDANIEPTLYSALAELGIMFAICLSGLAVGLASSWPARAACMAVARQPFFGQKILRVMLITQSIIQTPIIFCFIIAVFIKSQLPGVTHLADSLRLIASGLCIGLGSIGPTIGLSKFAATAVQGLGINRNAYGKLLSFTFISESIIETPIIFALVISLMLVSTTTLGPDNLLGAIAMVSAAACMGLGTIGPGISSGHTASAACHQIALNPDNHSVLSKVSMFGQGFIDTCAIYAFLIALMLMIV